MEGVSVPVIRRESLGLDAFRLQCLSDMAAGYHAVGCVCFRAYKDPLDRTRGVWNPDNACKAIAQAGVRGTGGYVLHADAYGQPLAVDNTRSHTQPALAPAPPEPELPWDHS